jgi:hypothetical protein
LENKRPIQRRDFLKSATAASVLAGAATLVVRADEPAKLAEGTQNQSSAGGSMVGQEAVDCLANLLRGMENVRSIDVFEAILTPKPKKRSIEKGSYYDFNSKRPIAVSADEEKIISKALELRDASHMPFWDAVLLVCHEHESVPHGLLQAAQHHAGIASTAKGQTLTRQQVLGGALKQMCQNKGSSKWVGMTSAVVLDDGSTAHIPMLNFRCRISPLNRKLVGEVTRQLLPGGAIILEAGTVYQAYGKSTIPQKSFAPLLGQALLFGNVVNHRYIAHQLIDGKCTVRISAGSSKKSVPVCVDVV